MLDTHSIKEKPILVIVDYQNDFVRPNGALPVPNAESIRKNIIDAATSSKYKYVILTVDWHCNNDFSFKEQNKGGKWSRHCVQYSEGAAIDSKLLEALISNNIRYNVFRKGMVVNVEEYGAFSLIRKDKDTVYVNDASGVSFNTLSFFKDDKFDICGVAGDYCVKETYNNLVKAGFEVTPLYDCIAFIGEPFKYSSHSQDASDNKD